MSAASLLNVSGQVPLAAKCKWLTVYDMKVFTIQSTVMMLPSIGKALFIPTHRQHMVSSYVSSSYSVASGASMLLWGRIADVYGRQPIFLMGGILFALSTSTVPLSVSGSAAVSSVLGNIVGGTIGGYMS
ncbi:hypothetical protein F5Y11DRAFT_334412 [Daldinia sp. FL1419]|nr:hypothetical protein F5Y11DRAFT_334412 [Daldinia sp. FL1419]